MDLEYRPVVETEFDAFARVGRIAFGQEQFPADMPWTFAKWEMDRTRAALVGDEIVGSGRNYSFTMTVPGGAVVPVAGVSWITVMPTHRRQGVLRGMMAELDAEARGRGEAISILTASEGGIYGRFGYGIATWRMHFEIDHARGSRSEVPPETGRVRFLERDEALAQFPAVYARACGLRPGMVSRPDSWWEETFYNVAPPDKANFFVLHEDRDGRADGFVSYDISGDFVGGMNHKTLRVFDLITLTPEARAGLWQFVFSIDLVETVAAVQMATDEPLRFLLSDPRQMRVSAVNDHLWLKVLDIERALEARRYATTDRLVIEVRDGPNTTRVELDGGPDGARCGVTTAEPDVVLGLAQLGSIYLGGTRAEQYVAAGTVEARTPLAVARLDAMFASYPSPTSPTWF